LHFQSCGQLGVAASPDHSSRDPVQYKYEAHASGAEDLLILIVIDGTQLG